MMRQRYTEDQLVVALVFGPLVLLLGALAGACWAEPAYYGYALLLTGTAVVFTLFVYAGLSGKFE